MAHSPRSVYVAAALGTLLSLAPAGADAPVPDGLICHFEAVVNPAGAGHYSGELAGGPVLLTEQDGTTLDSGTLTCRLQIDEPSHAGETVQSIEGYGVGVLTAGPNVISYYAAAGSSVYLCSEFTDDSDEVTYYFDDAQGHWSTDVNSPCGLASGGDTASPPIR